MTDANRAVDEIPGRVRHDVLGDVVSNPEFEILQWLKGRVADPAPNSSNFRLGASALLPVCKF
jgi:hypothetical protein